MDANTIAQLIGSVGFPIVAACGMFYLYHTTITSLNSILIKIDTTMQMVLSELQNISHTGTIE